MKKIMINTLLVAASSLAAAIVILAVFFVMYHNSLTKLRWPLGSHCYNDATGFEISRGISTRMLDNSFYLKTHQLGFRIPEFQDSKAIQKGGVLSIGCSYTFGDEVNAEDTFTFQTAKKLGLTAYNYGVCSYSFASTILQLRQLERDGLLDELNPKIVILGVGAWLYKRSLNPFFPTEGPQYAYAYIDKNNGNLDIVQPPEAYSTKHFYNLASQYFKGGTINTMINPRQFLLLSANLPKTFLAKLHKKRREKKIEEGQVDISREEVYNFVLESINDIVSRHKAQLVVLWMPYRSKDTIEKALVQSIKKFNNVILIDGREALTKHRVPKEQYRHTHPKPMAHLVYAEEIVRKLNTSPRHNITKSNLH